jgi:hypothetical protein
MNTDERDELWHLLGKAKQIEPNPFLARNVVRQIRLQDSPKRPFFLRIRSLALRWKLSVAACTTGILLLGVGSALNDSRIFKHSQGTYANAQDSGAVQAMATNPDYEIIAHLDEMIAFQENSIWTDASQD